MPQAFGWVNHATRALAEAPMWRIARIACVLVLAAAVPALAEEAAPAAPADANSTAANSAEATSTEAAPAEEAAYSKPQVCVRSRAIRKIQVLDQHHLLFRLWGGKYLINTTPKACPFMVGSRTISVSASRINRICGGNTVKAIEQGSAVYPNTIAEPEELAGFTVVGECTLGTFESISKEQVDALEIEYPGSGRRVPKRK